MSYIFFSPHSWHVKDPGSGIESVPQQWQCLIFNPLSHKGSPRFPWYLSFKELLNIQSDISGILPTVLDEDSPRNWLQASLQSYELCVLVKKKKKKKTQVPAGMGHGSNNIVFISRRNPWTYLVLLQTSSSAFSFCWEWQEMWLAWFCRQWEATGKLEVGGMVMKSVF